MADYKLGDVVWVRGYVRQSQPLIVDARDGYMPHPQNLCPDAPAPAELDDVAVLRRAAELLEDNASYHAAAHALGVARRIEVARRPPTPLEVLREFVAADDKELAHTPEMVERARRAIAAAEKGDV